MLPTPPPLGYIHHLCYHECHGTPRQWKPSPATKPYHRREALPAYKPGSPALPGIRGAPLWPTLLGFSAAGSHTFGSDGFVEHHVSLEFTKKNKRDARPCDSQGRDSGGQVADPPEGRIIRKRLWVLLETPDTRELRKEPISTGKLVLTVKYPQTSSLWNCKRRNVCCLKTPYSQYLSQLQQESSTQPASCGTTCITEYW